MKKLLLIAAVFAGAVSISHAGVNVSIGFGVPMAPPPVIISHPPPVYASPYTPVVVAPPHCAPPPVVIHHPPHHYGHRYHHSGGHVTRYREKVRHRPHGGYDYSYRVREHRH